MTPDIIQTSSGYSNAYVNQSIKSCGYVADKIRSACRGSKNDEKKEVKGIRERQCVLASNHDGKGLQNGNVYADNTVVSADANKDCNSKPGG
ncbi:hypothetical protein FSP39_005779 [Pinctada imbricata]|uniref:Uncharacterized protein n=1 Tax=Pinctada imbricata TaxID=66713 RepID=A0AA89C5B8_PINIB|nr:hypothetical protein FSP39_005779 [Pinctada imbricata]